MRYYHSAIDVDSLLRGNPYDQLKKSFVIFICNFDLCGDGFPVYESITTWRQNKKEIGDEQVKIVYNIGAFEKADDPKLKALLRYLSTETNTNWIYTTNGAKEKKKASKKVVRKVYRREYKKAVKKAATRGFSKPRRPL